MDENYTRISNEIMEALSRVNLTAHEWRVVWCVLRKTYGFQKKEDWIAVSQISEMTGLHKAHISRAKKLLHLRNIVTPRGNKIGFNKYNNTWKELPHGVNDHSKGKSVTPRDTKVTPRGISELPHGADTKETITKETIQKKVPKEENDERTGVSFKEILVREQWCDEHYADKTWNQGLALRSPHRENFFRKVGVVISSARHDRTKPFAKKVYHEIAGMVNDFGDMARHLSTPELIDRDGYSDSVDLEQV
jgi:phage replication O-like protein O